MKKTFKKAAIIGVGLIGGSLALALKKRKLASLVVGVSGHKETLRLARARGVIDQGSLGLDIIRGADLVVFATPVNTISELARKASSIAAEGCLVIDVGSTKEAIVNKLQGLFSNFVGTHPIAGSEKRGVAYARADIFENSLCILTPTKKTRPGALKAARSLWKSLGAKVVNLSPAGHDRAIAFVSHLPHIVVFSLMNSIPAGLLKLGAKGLKDTTRIAASDSRLWADIFLSNRYFLETVNEFQVSLSKLKKAIKAKDALLLRQLLDSARKKKEVLG